MRIDGFLVVMAFAVGAALMLPQGYGVQVEALDVMIRSGIALMFFLHGVALSPRELRSGAANWRLHLLVQAATFILFPLLGLALLWGLAGRLENDMLLGLFLLSALPSTVSSSVALVGVARGNVSAAVFNATVSGLAGVVLTPLLVSGVTSIGGSGLSLGAAIADVAVTLLLPFAVGQAIRPLLASRAVRFRRAIALLDRGVILLIIFGAFSRSTAEGLWARTDGMTLTVLALIVLTLFAFMTLVMTQAARAIRLSTADRITAVFCGSQKSLATGAPLAAILFANNPSLGIILMPTLLYHQLQLLVGASLARRYSEARIDAVVSGPPHENGAPPVRTARSTPHEKRKTI